jgi:tRNA(adenine34) deaminase
VPEDRYAAYDEAMGRALELAGRAEQAGDVPVGAVVVDADGQVVGEGLNVREARQDPTGHAETVALREAARHTGSWRLIGCTLVVTLEPCVMCAGAMVMARLPTVVFGAYDPKAGACGSVWDVARDPRANHRVTVLGGVREEECARLLLDFFAARRLR